jgi:hypothetical protein
MDPFLSWLWISLMAELLNGLSSARLQQEQTIITEFYLNIHL